MAEVRCFATFPNASLAWNTLERREVHLWSAGLDPRRERVEALERLLSDEEIERANRFHFGHDRRRFVVSHGLLRLVLSAYCGKAADELRYTAGLRGKPALAAGPAFNLSHSGELALIGVTATEPLGVDVELVQHMRDMKGIAQRFFSQAEWTDLRGLPEAQRPDAFYRCWTRKEAYLKALGDGLWAPLDEFDVTLLPVQPPRLRSVKGDPDEAAKWSLYHLEPKPGYFGALAIRGHDWKVSTGSIDLARITMDGPENP